MFQMTGDKTGVHRLSGCKVEYYLCYKHTSLSHQPSGRLLTLMVNG